MSKAATGLVWSILKRNSYLTVKLYFSYFKTNSTALIILMKNRVQYHVKHLIILYYESIAIF